MRHAQYILLDEPKQLSPSNDPEGPTVPAPVLKILNFTGIDEMHETTFVQFVYAYGFVNSKNQFKKLDNLVICEYVVDIDPVSRDGIKQVVGINPVSKQEEKAGNWLSDMLRIDSEQPGRCQGDFRMEDLYRHLINKLGIKGTIKKVVS